MSSTTGGAAATAPSSASQALGALGKCGGDFDPIEDEHRCKVETWLDEHPDFFKDYLIRKGTRGMIDCWLVAHTLPTGVSAIALENVDEETITEDANEDDDDGDDDDRCGEPFSGDSCNGGAMGPEGGAAGTTTIVVHQSIPGQNSSSSSHNNSCSSSSNNSSSKNFSSSGSKCSSGSGTPVRKISAHEFERGGLTFKPLVTTIDGTPTFLSPATASETISGQIRKKSRQDVVGLDEADLIFELVKDICHDLDVKSLCHKILQNVGILTSADRCSLFLVHGEGGPAGSRCLVSNLFDVSSSSTVEEMNQKTEIKIPWGSGIVGHVAETGEAVNIEDCYQDSRFHSNVDVMTGYRTRSMMCHPIKEAYTNNVLGVAQVINKVAHHVGGGGGGDPKSPAGSAEHGVVGGFSAHDESVFSKYLQFCGIGLRNAQLYERSQLEVRRNQVLLDLAGVIFQEQSTIDNMIDRILTHMISLIRCERASLLLCHESSQGTFSHVFDLDSKELDEMDKLLDSGCCPNDLQPLRNRKRPKEGGRFPINTGVTGYVAATGETVNIPNAYEDERFDPSVDEEAPKELGFRHKTILCMPIKYCNKPNRPIGVFQLVNKFDDLPFTKNDENFVEAFAIFCGMGIQNVRMYEKTCQIMAKQQVTLEVLSYHATGPLNLAMKLARQKIPSAAALQLRSLAFDDFSLTNDETLQAAVRMFIDLDFNVRFHIDYNVLCRWLVSVRKNYREVAYHNWRHAFNVAQMMFAILTSTHWWRKLGEVECLSLIIACLCHDLDHRGTNNSFQIKSSSSLAQLYSTSTMEHHHFDQCLMILNSKGNQILANLSQDEFKRVVHLLEDAILATDLAVYFRRRDETFQRMQDTPIDGFVKDHERSLLRGLLMTACDLGAITKPWPIQKKVARLVAQEFFEQGDMERVQLQIEPIDMMNREKIDRLPDMQVNFIDSICLPIYRQLGDFSADDNRLSPLLQGCLSNRQEWARLAEKQIKSWADLDDHEQDRGHRRQDAAGSQIGLLPPP